MGTRENGKTHCQFVVNIQHGLHGLGKEHENTVCENKHRCSALRIKFIVGKMGLIIIGFA